MTITDKTKPVQQTSGQAKQLIVKQKAAKGTVCPKCGKLLKRVKAGFICGSCGAKFKISEKPQPSVTKDKEGGLEQKDVSPLMNLFVTGATFAAGLAVITLLAALGLKANATDSRVMAAEMDTIKEEEVTEEATEETALQKSIREWKEEEPEKKPEYTDGRIHTFDDIPDKTVSAMVLFTTADLKEKVASQADAMELYGGLLDSRHKAMFPEGDDKNKHPYSYWASYEPGDATRPGSVTFGDPLAVDTFLVMDKKNEDRGIFYILYEMQAEGLFSYTMMPGESDSMTDKVYMSYSYEVNLADAEMPIDDFNNYVFGGADGADIDKNSWELRNIKKHRDEYELIDESIPAKG